MNEPVLRVLYLASEAAPFIKVGGLGDVAGVLPQEIRKLFFESGDNIRRVDIRLALPLHHQINRNQLDMVEVARFTVPHKNGHIPAVVYETRLNELPVYLVDSPIMPESGPLYAMDAAADGLKFTFFSLAVLELVRKLDWPPHIIHANDWHTAPALYQLYLIKSHDFFFYNTRGVLTVHNLPYLGVNAESALEDFGLPPIIDSDLPWWAKQMPLPLGLYTADLITTVSHGYAEEMQTEPFGAGLNYFLARNNNKLVGILNGLDTAYWNPVDDPYLVETYDADTLDKRLQNKKALQKALDLPLNHKIPLMAMVSRMDYQKGIDLALETLRCAAEWQWQLVILGQGSPDLEAAANALQTEFPERVRIDNTFNEPLGHRLFGSADAILIPSRYEPCGTTQMIGMRYGCVPIGHAVGGLRDTIIDYEAAPSKATGFLFDDLTVTGFSAKIGQMLATYADKRRWHGIMRRGMKMDFSWHKSARQYADLYLQLMHKSNQHHRN